MMSKSIFLFPIIFPLNFFICISYSLWLIFKRFGGKAKIAGLILSAILSVVFYFLSNSSTVSNILILGLLFYINLQAISIAFALKYRSEEENEEDEEDEESAMKNEPKAK